MQAKIKAKSRELLEMNDEKIARMLQEEEKKQYHIYMQRRGAAQIPINNRCLTQQLEASACSPSSNLVPIVPVTPLQPTKTTAKPSSIASSSSSATSSSSSISTHPQHNQHQLLEPTETDIKSIEVSRALTSLQNLFYYRMRARISTQKTLQLALFFLNSNEQTLRMTNLNDALFSLIFSPILFNKEV